MNNLPKGMIADRDNVVYFDTERMMFYMIVWEDGGTRDIPHRIYIPLRTNVISDRVSAGLSDE